MTDPLRSTPSGKPRARTLGIDPRGIPGPWNAITDVPGVEVGYATLIEGDGVVRTGVTAIHPRGRADPGDPCAAGCLLAQRQRRDDGHGLDRGVGRARRSRSRSRTPTRSASPTRRRSRWTIERAPGAHRAVGAAGRGRDLGRLPERHQRPPRDRASVVIAALDAARGGPVEEGSVGGGTGMNCYDFKGGVGHGLAPWSTYGGGRATPSASSCSPTSASRHELVVAGVPLGRDARRRRPDGRPSPARAAGAGSVIAIVATDAPLLPGQCKALARRVPLGLARTGTTGSHFSGDLFLAFSTANHGEFAIGLGAGAVVRRRHRHAALPAVAADGSRSSRRPSTPPRRRC